MAGSGWRVAVKLRPRKLCKWVVHYSLAVGAIPEMIWLVVIFALLITPNISGRYLATIRPIDRSTDPDGHWPTPASARESEADRAFGINHLDSLEQMIDSQSI